MRISLALPALLAVRLLAAESAIHPQIAPGSPTPATASAAIATRESWDDQIRRWVRERIASGHQPQFISTLLREKVTVTGIDTNGRLSIATAGGGTFELPWKRLGDAEKAALILDLTSPNRSADAEIRRLALAMR